MGLSRKVIYSTDATHKKPKKKTKWPLQGQGSEWFCSWLCAGMECNRGWEEALTISCQASFTNRLAGESCVVIARRRDARQTLP